MKAANFKMSSAMILLFICLSIFGHVNADVNVIDDYNSEEGAKDTIIDLPETRTSRSSTTITSTEFKRPSIAETTIVMESSNEEMSTSEPVTDQQWMAQDEKIVEDAIKSIDNSFKIMNKPPTSEADHKRWNNITWPIIKSVAIIQIILAKTSKSHNRSIETQENALNLLQSESSNLFNQIDVLKSQVDVLNSQNIKNHNEIEKIHNISKSLTELIKIQTETVDWLNQNQTRLQEQIQLLKVQKETSRIVSDNITKQHYEDSHDMGGHRAIIFVLIINTMSLVGIIAYLIQKAQRSLSKSYNISMADNKNGVVVNFDDL